MSTTRQTLSAVQRATTHGLGSLTDSELLTLALLGEYEQDWRRYQDDFDSLLSHHGGLKALTGATHPSNQPTDHRRPPHSGYRPSCSCTSGFPPRNSRTAPYTPTIPATPPQYSSPTSAHSRRKP